ncbi:MAG: hypothetical protein MRZ79_00105 [Bacteroidia bacterium]|nr:hypothetical protein [Bacteroidia bacterium]
MFNKQNTQNGNASNRFNGNRPNRRPLEPQPSQGIDLFPIAVFIMGIVSCYTTATGLYPMLDNWILSYATAIALSVFMVAIALRIPKAYKEGNQTKLILGYIFVASFSVLLNFNAIYGVFTSEKLLYEELKENKSQLTAVRVSAKGALDKYFDTRDIEQKLTEAKALLKEETTNRVEPGYGKKARKLNKEVVIPLEAQMETIRSRYNPAVKTIDSLSADAQKDIDAALTSGKIKEYRKAVDKSIDVHSQIGEMTTNLVGEENFAFEPIIFQHRDVGNLNHSLWTLTNIGKLDAKQASSVIVSLLLSLLIDFIVLFVIVMINRPGKDEKEEEEELESSNGRNTFQAKQGKVQAQNSNSGIYAYRKPRTANKADARPYREELRKTESPVLEEPAKVGSIQEPKFEKPMDEALPVIEETDTQPPVWEIMEENELVKDELETPENDETPSEVVPQTFERETELSIVAKEDENLNGHDHSETSLIPFHRKF